MPRKQIKPEHDYPLSTMEEREALNSNPTENGSRPASLAVVSTTNNSPSVEKHKQHEDDYEIEPVKDLLVYYAQNSTMHGVPSIVGSELYRGRHIFWMCVVCIMALLLGTVVYWQMSDYYNYPTVTSVDIRYVKDGDFPAITICDLNTLNAGDIKILNDSFTAYHLAKLTEITGLYHMALEKIMSRVPIPPENATYNSSERIPAYLEATKARYNKLQLKCSWGDYFWTRCPCTHARLTEMGLCVTVDVNRLVKDVSNNSSDVDDDGISTAVSNAMRGLTMFLDIPSEEIPYRIYHNTGLKLVLHDPHEEPLPLSSGFLVEANKTVEVEISKNMKEGLPPPFKAFGGSICVDTQWGSFKSPLHRFPNYTKEACETECFMDFVVATCQGCKHFLHPGNELPCEVEHLSKCYVKAQKLYYGGKNRTKCDCPLPCVQSTYKAAVTSSAFVSTQYFLNIQRNYSKKALNQNCAYVHFFFSDPVVTTMRQVAIYSAEGLLGSIGGQIGLFMGFSLVTVAEMLELIFLLATRGRKLDERVKRHKENEAAVQAALQATA